MSKSYVKILGYDLQELKILGETGFATSYLAESKEGKKYVVKKFHIEKIDPNHLLTIFENNRIIKEAIKKHSSVEGCKNVREIYSVGNNSEPYIISEYLTYNLEEYMEKRKISIEQAIQICLDIARCLKFVFDNSKIKCHGDICPQNIFLYEVNGKLIVKVGDFDGALTTDRTIQPVLTHLKYNPPELSTLNVNMLEERKFDVYSLGLILAELVAGPQTVNSILKGLDVSNEIGVQEIGELVKDAIKHHYKRINLDEFIRRLEFIKKPFATSTISILKRCLINLEEIRDKLKTGQTLTDSDEEKYEKLKKAWPKIERLMELWEEKKKEEIEKLSEELNRELP